MEIIMGKYAGYCHGVAKAVAVFKIHADKDLTSYGSVVNNKQVTGRLADRGVNIIENIDEAEEGRTVVIRSHGVAPDVYEGLEEKGIDYIDATCPDVKKVHDVVRQAKEAGHSVIIVGSADHPEIIGIFGHASGNEESGREVVIIANMSEAEAFEPILHMTYSLVVQTTYDMGKFEAIAKKLEENVEGLIINDTICPTTYRRQSEAEELSKICDAMIVVGDHTSSNTNKLYEISKKNCKKTYLIETKADLELKNLAGCGRVGVVAGASTPPDTIKEAVSLMMAYEETTSQDSMGNNQDFQEMLDDSLVSLHTGDVVKGKVISVVNGEVNVNLNYKSDGVIPRGEFSSNDSDDPAQLAQPGEEIEVFVISVNDRDGIVQLSKKKLDSQRHLNELGAAYEDKSVITVKIHSVVKGGLIAYRSGVRIFVPSSQVANRFVSNETLEKLVGTDMNLEIIEFDRGRKRIVGGRRDLAKREEVELKQKVFDSIEEGARIKGKVSRISNFGAFVDLGGADGLIHVSQLSWGNVRRVSDVVSEGDNVEVIVLDIDREKGKISLSLKHVTEDPWATIEDRYYIGQVLGGRVVRIVPFGAFVELESGVDGLVHISQLSHVHVEKPDDVVSVGQEIDVKIINIDLENNKISLSKKQTEAQQGEAQQGEAQQDEEQQEDDYSKYLGSDIGPDISPSISPDEEV